MSFVAFLTILGGVALVAGLGLAYVSVRVLVNVVRWLMGDKPWIGS
jgi:hypothetical protein